MKNQHLFACLLSATVFLSGCAAGLSSAQKREYQAYKHENVLVEEKNPTLGAVLGLLPGGGSFYAGEPALGIVNLLFWPMSIMWDPVSGYDGSMAVNYDVTKHSLKKAQEKEISSLEERRSNGEVDEEVYVSMKRNIEKRYDY